MLTPPPRSYRGLVSTFIHQYVATNFPPPPRLDAWIEALLEYYLRGADPVCIVRGTQRGALRKEQSTRVVGSDNAPGIWAYLRCLDGTVQPHQLSGLLDSGEIPVLMALARDQRAQWTYGKAMASADKKRLWGIGLKHCHILPARRNARHLDARQLALRNICPVNQFLFPSPRWFDMAQHEGSKRVACDLGESRAVIAWVSHKLREHLQRHQTALYAFSDAAGEGFPDRVPADFEIEVAQKSSIADQAHGDQSVPAATSPSVLRDRVMESDARGAGPVCRWTLNVLHGHYVRTGVSEEVLNVALSYKGPGEHVQYVGLYRLDLPTLSEAGAVTRRSGKNGPVYDVRIVRDTDGSFWLARGRVRIPLGTSSAQ